LPNTERGAAGLISRFVEYIRVARLFAPGAHFLSIVVAYWVVLSVAYHLVLFIAYCTVFVVVSFSSLRIVQSSFRVSSRSD